MKTNPGHGIIGPVWSVRLLSALSLLAIGLAQFVFKTGSPLHDALLGFAAGLLIGLFVVSLQIKEITLSDDNRSDIQTLSLS